MKLDLILENVRNSYTLNLLEESSVQGIDEKEVLMGKMLINESTMMVRRILVEEGVMEDVKLVLENTFAQIIEEFSFDSDEVLDGASRVGKAIVNVPLGAVDGLTATGGAGAGMGAYAGADRNQLVPSPIESAQNGYASGSNPIITGLGASGLAAGAAGAGLGYLLGRRGIRR